MVVMSGRESRELKAGEQSGAWCVREGVGGGFGGRGAGWGAGGELVDFPPSCLWVSCMCQSLLV